GVEVLVLDAGVVGDVGAPLGRVATAEVVAVAGQLLEAGRLGGWVGAEEAGLEHGALEDAGSRALPGHRLVQVDDRGAGSDEEGVALAAGEEVDAGVGLARVQLE